MNLSIRFTKLSFLIFIISTFVWLGALSTQATFDFDLLLTPPNFASIVQGNSVSITVGAVLRGDTTTPISFSVSGLPLGATASFHAPGSNTADITITTSTATPAGISPITIIARGDGIAKTTTFTLTVTAPRTFHGDGTYVVKDGDSTILDNGLEIIASVKKNRDFSDIEVSLTLPNTMGYWFILPGMERKLYDDTQRWVKNGAIFRLNFQNKDKEEAEISFQSTRGLGDWSGGLILLLGVSIITFLLEFIIKLKSQKFLYRYTLIRSVILGLILSFVVAGLIGGEWAFIVFFWIAPIVIIDTILFSFIAYKVVAKRKTV